jgi:hypothetical protein
MAQVEEGPSKYDGDKIIEMIEGFGDPLNNHLNDEIATLHPEILKQIFNSPDEAKVLVEQMVKWGVETCRMSITIVFVIQHSDTI